MKLPDLDELGTLEAIAGAAWLEVHNPTGAGESINPIVNREQAFIRAVRADQAVAQWYVDHSVFIKRVIRECHAVVLEGILSLPPSQ